MKHGRKSAADLALTVVDGGFSSGRRPDPPDELTARQKEIWLAVVQDEPLDFFSTQATRNLLKNYCFAEQKLEELAEAMNKIGPDDKDYARLQKAWDVASKAAVMLATKLRITNQARYTTISAGNSSRNTLKAGKPWQ